MHLTPNPSIQQHYIFPSSGDGLYLVVDEKARFREDNFQKAMAVLQAGPDDEIAQASAGGNENGGGNKKRRGGKLWVVDRGRTRLSPSTNDMTTWHPLE